MGVPGMICDGVAHFLEREEALLVAGNEAVPRASPSAELVPQLVNSTLLFDPVLAAPGYEVTPVSATAQEDCQPYQLVVPDDITAFFSIVGLCFGDLETRLDLPAGEFSASRPKSPIDLPPLEAGEIVTLFVVSHAPEAVPFAAALRYRAWRGQPVIGCAGEEDRVPFERGWCKCACVHASCAHNRKVYDAITQLTVEANNVPAPGPRPGAMIPPSAVQPALHPDLAVEAAKIRDMKESFRTAKPATIGAQPHFKSWDYAEMMRTQHNALRAAEGNRFAIRFRR